MLKIPLSALSCVAIAARMAYYRGFHRAVTYHSLRPSYQGTHRVEGGRLAQRSCPLVRHLCSVSSQTTDIKPERIPLMCST